MVLRWIKSLLDVPSNAILLVYAGMDQIARYLVACFISYEDWLDQLKTLEHSRFLQIYVNTLKKII